MATQIDYNAASGAHSGVLQITGRALDGGDKLVGPLGEGQATLVCVGLYETDGLGLAWFQPATLVAQSFPSGKLDLDKLPKGWELVSSGAADDAAEAEAPAVKPKRGKEA